MTGAGGVPATVHRAPAKLTRTLRIVGVREDGYHLLDSEMVTLGLADELTFAPGAGLTVVDEVPGGAGLPVPTGAENLVARALSAVGGRAAVRVVKRIPAGAGLGGASADAAAVLRWAGVVADPAGLEVAASLGADVPFCLLGGRARVRGVGEIVEPMEPADVPVTLLLPPFGMSTPAVYRRWNDLGGPSGPAGNDLEAAAVDLDPRLAAWGAALGEAAGCQPRLAGSGSTWFVEAACPDLAGPMSPPPGAGDTPGWVVVTRTQS